MLATSKPPCSCVCHPLKCHPTQMSPHSFVTHSNVTPLLCHPLKCHPTQMSPHSCVTHSNVTPTPMSPTQTSPHSCVTHMQRQKESPPQLPYGETSYVLSTSYFLGQLHPGQSLQSIESSMFRSPIYPHTMPDQNFLVIRSGDRWGGGGGEGLMWPQATNQTCAVLWLLLVTVPMVAIGYHAHVASTSER